MPAVAEYSDQLSGNATETRNSGCSSSMADDEDNAVIVLGNHNSDDFDEIDSDFEPLSVRVKKRPCFISGASDPMIIEGSSRQSINHFLEQVGNSSKRSIASDHKHNHADLLEALQATSPPPISSHRTVSSWLTASNPFSVSKGQDHTDSTQFHLTPNSASRKRKVFFGGKTNVSHSEVQQFQVNSAHGSLVLKNGHVLVSDTDEESD